MMNNPVILAPEEWAEFSAELTKFRSRVAELEAEKAELKEMWADLHEQACKYLDRAETLQSRLADIAGLQRYSLVYDEMQQYDDGMYVRADELQAALGQG
jgi:predicted  nucleic acid-binding Zn-ribbon protein